MSCDDSEPEENKFITECVHCLGLGCDYCEDITLAKICKHSCESDTDSGKDKDDD